MLATSSILNRAGALTESIRNDYGEDLLVQTHLNGFADDFRLLVQVKGTALKVGPDGVRKIRLNVDHLRRWVSQADPILVCVFDDLTGLVYAFAPNERFSLWSLSTTSKKTMTIGLLESDEFNERTATRFIWWCRIGHWSRMFSWYESHANYHEMQGGKRSDFRKVEREGNIVVLNFLKSVGVIEKDVIAEEFRQKIIHCSTNLGADNKNKSTDFQIEDVFALALLGHVDDLCGVGLPSNLFVNGQRVCAVFFKSWHSAEWLDAKQRLAVVA